MDRSTGDRSTVHGGAGDRGTVHGSAVHGGTVHGGTVHGGTGNRGAVHGSTGNGCTIYGSTGDRGTVHGGTGNRSAVHGGTGDRGTFDIWRWSADRRFCRAVCRQPICMGRDKSYRRSGLLRICTDCICKFRTVSVQNRRVPVLRRHIN